MTPTEFPPDGPAPQEIDLNFYPFHIGDYASATRHLSWDEDMAYRRLMDAYYTREAHLPLDRRQIYRITCASTEAQRMAVDTVLAEFFTETPDGYKNSRCDAEILKAKDKKNKAAESARIKWSKANAMRADSERNANASESACERIEKQCEGYAPNPNPNPNPKVNLEEANASSAPRRKRREAAEVKNSIGFDYENGQWDGIREADAQDWAVAYPALDIDTELFRAAEWIKANPANRKSNWRRFLTNWFSRAQDRAPRRAAA